MLRAQGEIYDDMHFHSRLGRNVAILLSFIGLGGTAVGCHRTDAPSSIATLYGIPVYPGAAKSANLGSGTLPPQDGLAMAVLESSDAPQKVVAFYRQNLIKPHISQYDRNGSPVVSLSDVLPDNSVRNVRVFDEGGRTAIEMMSVKAQPSGKPVVLPGPSAIP